MVDYRESRQSPKRERLELSSRLVCVCVYVCVIALGGRVFSDANIRNSGASFKRSQTSASINIIYMFI